MLTAALPLLSADEPMPYWYSTLLALLVCKKVQMLTPEEVRGRGWTDPHKTNGLMSASMPMKVGAHLSKLVSSSKISNCRY
jgi:hypothetical protein